MRRVPRRHTLLLFVILWTSALWAADRPNVVLIMADDLGFSDIGCYGGEIATPNLDRLAAGGLRFTQFYNTGRCCPTRAALLTGLYPHQVGIGTMTNKEFDFGLPGYRGFLQRNGVTIAEALKPTGYRTFMVGKWHVGKKEGVRPLDRGFDEYYGVIEGASHYFDPTPGNMLYRNRTPVKAEGDNYYLTDAFTDHAIRFVTDTASRDDKPFFLYVAYTAPHWPLHAPAEDVAKYRGRYRIGWDKLRQQRHTRMTRLGMNWVLSPRMGIVPPSPNRGWMGGGNPVPAWDELTEEQQDNLDLRMAIYAAMVDRMDQNIGRLVEALRQAGRLDNTLILFLSDNGAEAGGGAVGFDQFKPPVYSEQAAAELGGPRSFSSYGSGWANASNTPLRYAKCMTYEGGIATPLIAHWPAGIAQQGQWSGQVGHVIDIMATCMDLAGASYPSHYNGHDILPLEGRSLAPVFEGRQRQGHATLFWEHYGGRAVRMGRWKLVGPNPRLWELYDMDADRSELHNVAEEHPELVRQMSQLYESWARRCNVEPWPVQRLSP